MHCRMQRRALQREYSVTCAKLLFKVQFTYIQSAYFIQSAYYIQSTYYFQSADYIQSADWYHAPSVALSYSRA